MMKKFLPNTIAQNIARQIVSQNEDFKGQTDEIRYGLEWIISTLNLLVLVLIFSIPLNILPEALVFTVTMAIFRAISGGAHCKGYFPCLIISTLQVLISSTIIQYAFHYLVSLKLLFVILLLLSFIIVLVYAPVLNKKKNCFTKEQKHNLKIGSVMIFLAFFTISVTLFKGTELMYSVWFALIIQSSSLTYPAKLILDYVSTPINKGKEVRP